MLQIFDSSHRFFFLLYLPDTTDIEVTVDLNGSDTNKIGNP